MLSAIGQQFCAGANGLINMINVCFNFLKISIREGSALIIQLIKGHFDKLFHEFCLLPLFTRDYFSYSSANIICLLYPMLSQNNRHKMPCSAPSHYLNQCWLIVNWIPQEQIQLEIVDQWSTRIPLPSRRGSSRQCMDCNWTSFKITTLLSEYPQTQVMCCWSLDLMFKDKLKLESGNWKIQYGRQSAIVKVTLLKINRLLSIHTSNLLLKFGLHIQSQTKVRIRKLKNPIWPPGGHFESDIAENQ